MTAPARLAAFRVLRDVHEERANLAHAQSEVRMQLEDRRDRALAMEIASGTLRWRARLDHAIAQASSRRIARIEPQVLDILRLSIYQLHHLRRVPRHAVIHDAVDLTRTAGRPHVASFVNAVLRKLAETKVSFPRRPSDGDDPTPSGREAARAYLSITQSHPGWLVDRWLNRYGFEATDRWTQFNNAAPTVTIRTNTAWISPDKLAVALAAEGIVVRSSKSSPAALIATRGNPLTSQLADRGFFWVQNEASQLVAELATAKPGQHVLDACAAPGGKSLIIAHAMQGRGTLVAGDRRPSRTRLLRRQIEAAGAVGISVVQLDARHPPSKAVFDWVIVDAPCSGFGMLRRDPDIKWRRGKADLKRLAAEQVSLLAGASAAVRPGGRLLYATCSSEPEENDDVVARFLSAHPGFDPVPPDAPGLGHFVEQDGVFRTLPFRDNLDGFFATILRRTPD